MADGRADDAERRLLGESCRLVDGLLCGFGSARLLPPNDEVDLELVFIVVSSSDGCVVLLQVLDIYPRMVFKNSFLPHEKEQFSKSLSQLSGTDRPNDRPTDQLTFSFIYIFMIHPSSHSRNLYASPQFK